MTVTDKDVPAYTVAILLNKLLSLEVKKRIFACYVETHVNMTMNHGQVAKKFNLNDSDLLNIQC